MENLKDLQEQLKLLKKKIKDNKQVNSKDIGDRIKNLRKDNDLSQEGLADLIGMTRTNINNIESGRTTITVNNLFAVCELFNVSSDFILGLKEVK